jgi:uncharacterized membrane protein YdfJ with MMPL/SSD domain
MKEELEYLLYRYRWAILAFVVVFAIVVVIVYEQAH